MRTKHRATRRAEAAILLRPTQAGPGRTWSRWNRGAAGLAICLAIALSGCSAPVGAETPLDETAGAGTQTETQLSKEITVEQAIFAAGCFWGVEAAFRQIEGVTETEVGYSGGHTENPTYKQVCTGTTGHAEVVRVFFDPEKVSYEQLLEVFWNCHDPTQLNRQGPDVGTQYRSAIFYLNDEQARAAEESKRALAQSGRYPRKIVTQVDAAGPFYRAEEYHQQYLEKRGRASCRVP